VKLIALFRGFKEIESLELSNSEISGASWHVLKVLLVQEYEKL